MENAKKINMSSMYGRFGGLDNDTGYEPTLVEKVYDNIGMDISIYGIGENVDVFIRDGLMIKNNVSHSFVGKEVDVESWLIKCVENYDSILVITGDTAIHKYFE